MNKYQSLRQKALGLAFIFGPLLMTCGAAAYVLGIGLTPFGTDSWVDGIFLAYGGLMMVPVFLELARILGQRAPIFGLVCAIAGLCWALIVVAAAAKLMQIDIINAGLNESIWNVIGTAPGWAPLFIGLGLLHLAPLLLGIGFLWKGGVSRWTAVLLILAAMFFVIGVGGGADIAWWQTTLMYPLACLTFLAGLAPLGWRYWSGDRQARKLDIAASTGLS